MVQIKRQTLFLFKIVIFFPIMDVFTLILSFKNITYLDY